MAREASLATIDALMAATHSRGDVI